MIDSPAREVLKRDPDSHASTHRYIDHVSPSPKAWASAIFAHDLERVGVDMKWVIEIHHHPASVNDLPLLDGSNLGDSIDPFPLRLDQ